MDKKADFLLLIKILLFLIGIQGSSQHSSAYISLYLFSVSFSISISSQKLSSVSSRLYKISVLSTSFFLPCIPLPNSLATDRNASSLNFSYIQFFCFLFFLFQNTSLKVLSTSKPSFFFKEAAKNIPPTYFFFFLRMYFFKTLHSLLNEMEACEPISCLRNTWCASSIVLCSLFPYILSLWILFH